MPSDNYASLNVKELREIARAAGIRSLQKLRKEELITAIRQHEAQAKKEEPVHEAPKPRTKRRPAKVQKPEVGAAEPQNGPETAAEAKTEKVKQAAADQTKPEGPVQETAKQPVYGMKPEEAVREKTEEALQERRQKGYVQNNRANRTGQQNRAGRNPRQQNRDLRQTRLQQEDGRQDRKSVV